MVEGGGENLRKICTSVILNVKIKANKMLPNVCFERVKIRNYFVDDAKSFASIIHIRVVMSRRRRRRLCGNVRHYGSPIGGAEKVLRDPPKINVRVFFFVYRVCFWSPSFAERCQYVFEVLLIKTDSGSNFFRCLINHTQ